MILREVCSSLTQHLSKSSRNKIKKLLIDNKSTKADLISFSPMFDMDSLEDETLR